jgi:hypothetical protein
VRQLVYVSTASALPHGDLEQILTSATRNNAAAGITGLLLFNGRNFLQLLEGEGAAIDTLLDRVEADPRHSGVVVVTDIEVAERNFPDWSMRLLRLAESIGERRGALESFLPESLDVMVRRHILNFAALN